jgi:menaquinone-specific isochorismate synthase
MSARVATTADELERYAQRAVAAANTAQSNLLVALGIRCECHALLEGLAALASPPLPCLAFARGDWEMVGLGAAATLVADGAQRASQLADAVQAVARFELGDILPEWARPRWLGGLAFNEHVDGQEWAGFPPALLVRPVVLAVRHGADGALVLSSQVAPGASPVRLAQQWGIALELGLQLAQSPRRASAGPTEQRGLWPGSRGGGGRGQGAFPPRPSSSSAANRSPCLRANEIVADWPTRVAEALDEIAAGRLEKAVLACRKRWPLLIAPLELLIRLQQRFPDCLNVLVDPGDGAALVCATPELLLARWGLAIESCALAGSAARGTNAAADCEAAAALLGSTKNLREHALVVEAITAALQPACSKLEVAREPSLRWLANVIHLATPIHGELRAPRHLFELIETLHPTPALAGTPRAAALELIARQEPRGRGWYGGTVGWVDDQGDGEQWVAIRAALVHSQQDELIIHAGAGVVAGSQAATEWAEIEVKMAALGELMTVSPAA